jgi:hypothetical protein
MYWFAGQGTGWLQRIQIFCYASWFKIGNYDGGWFAGLSI